MTGVTNTDPLHNEETLSCTDDANERLVEVYCYFNAPIRFDDLTLRILTLSPPLPNMV